MMMSTSYQSVQRISKHIIFSLLTLFHFSDSHPIINNYACIPPHDSYPFCNSSLSITARAQSLVSLLTLSEKIHFLSNNASAVPRLGVPAYEWWSESLHGIASNGPGVSFDGEVKSATLFPQVILSAAAFNRTLWRAIASAIAEEALSMNNLGQAGLTFWAPNINVFRDPRWGRGQETPGEDPMVVSAYAIEYVKAFQGIKDDGDGTLRLSACCKHFAAYDLEKWGGFSRYNFNAVVTAQDMLDTYQAPFRSCISQGNASCLMCSYNAVNGVPSCADRDLLQKARTEWNFRGYITSDCDAVATIYEDQKFTKTKEGAVADAIKAGTDINCGTYMLRHMKSAVKQGKVSEEDINKALLNLFTVQLRLGLFDGKRARNQFRNFGPKDVCSSDHRKLALEASRQGIVLLKNDDKLLPLNKRGISSLAVIGPLANSTDLGGTYTGIPCKPMSILDGLHEQIDVVYHASGCVDVPCNSTLAIPEAVSVAKSSDYMIIVAGLDLSQETEDLDRYSLLLPGYQTSLVNAIADVSKKPVVLVLTGGGPIDVSFAVGNDKIGSVLWIGYPGETGGRALADVIFGHYNPGGKLPMTWYPESFTRVPMTDMNMRPDPARNYPGRTYRFYTGEVVYGFGHGLSYTKFSYKLLSAPRKLILPKSIFSEQRRNMLGRNSTDFISVDEVAYCNSLTFQVHISVTNEGEINGSEVVFLFSKKSSKSFFKGSPEKQLIGFERISLLPYETVETGFRVDPCEHLSAVDERGNRILATGDHVLMLDEVEHIVSIESF